MKRPTMGRAYKRPGTQHRLKRASGPVRLPLSPDVRCEMTNGSHLNGPRWMDAKAAASMLGQPRLRKKTSEFCGMLVEPHKDGQIL